MRPEHAQRLLQAMERKLLAARRLCEGPIDGAVARDYIAAIEAEQSARERMLLAPTPRSANRSERA